MTSTPLSSHRSARRLPHVVLPLSVVPRMRICAISLEDYALIGYSVLQNFRDFIALRSNSYSLSLWREKVFQDVALDTLQAPANDIDVMTVYPTLRECH